MMRSLLAALLAWCCGFSASGQDNPAAPALPAPVSAPVPAPAGAFTEAEKDILSQFEDIIELHDWLALLDHVDPKHRDARTGSGVSHAQYVAELLGLFYDGNSIAGEDGKVEGADLSRIRQISWKRKGRAEGDSQSVFGTVTLDDGDSLLIEIHWRQTQGGGYILTGAAS